MFVVQNAAPVWTTVEIMRDQQGELNSDERILKLTTLGCFAQIFRNNYINC